MDRRRIAKSLLKLLLSLGALAYVLHKVDLHQVLSLMGRVAPLWIVAALLAFNLSKVVSSLRLNRFFHALGLRLSELDALKLYYIGMFYNLFLPGGIGGDGYKIYLLNRHRQIGAKALLAATLLDRISGLASLLFFAAVLFLLSRYAELYGWMVPLAWLGMAAVFPVTRLFYRAPFRRVFLSTTLLGALTQILQLAAAYALARGLGLEHAMTETLALFLLSSVAAVLPLSVGGVGIREFVFLYGFGVLGLPVDKGVAFSLLFFLISALSSFTGIFLRHGLEQEERQR